MVQTAEAEAPHTIASTSISIDKLARFLSGWTGGPKLYSEKYGPIRIPMAHQHLPIGEAERDAWMRCMERALDAQPDYSDDLKRYLMEQLFVPAERVRVVCERRAAERAGRRESTPLVTVATETAEEDR